jgi:hypothetical protein
MKINWPHMGSKLSSKAMKEPVNTSLSRKTPLVLKKADG